MPNFITILLGFIVANITIFNTTYALKIENRTKQIISFKYDIDIYKHSDENFDYSSPTKSAVLHPGTTLSIDEDIAAAKLACKGKIFDRIRLNIEELSIITRLPQSTGYVNQNERDMSLYQNIAMGVKSLIHDYSGNAKEAFEGSFLISKGMPVTNTKEVIFIERSDGTIEIKRVK